MINVLLLFGAFSILAEANADCNAQPLRLNHPFVQASIYKAEKSTRSILIIPPTGGENFFDRSYAEKFCEAGVTAYILQNWQGKHAQSLSLSIHETLLSRAQNAIDRVLNEIPSHKIGIFGTSVGGIHAATAFVRSPKIDKAFLIVAGAPVASVIAESAERTLSSVREKRLKAFNFDSTDEYKAALAKKIVTGPLLVSPSDGKKALAAVVATKDDTVASQYQMQLVDTLGADPVLKFHSGHFFTIFQTWMFHSDKVLDFFQSDP